MKARLTLALSLLLPLACGGGGDDDARTQPPASELPVTAGFDLGADLRTQAHFFDFPYPSDLRLTKEGGPDTTGWPNYPDSPVQLLEVLRPVAQDRRGFPQVPVAYFKLTEELTPQDGETPIPAVASSPFLLVDVDSASPERGKLVPVVATTFPGDEYVQPNTVGVAPYPGFVLAPKRAYAFVVRTSAPTVSGSPLPAPPALTALLAGTSPGRAWGERAVALYKPLADTLPTLGLTPKDLASATVFTTGDVVGELAALADRVMADYDVALDGLHVDPDDGATHPRYCELVGTVKYPVFQRGKPPYDKDGLIDVQGGAPVKQGEASAPFRITLPKQAMPAGGYPLVLFLHGSGGLSSALVDRGTWAPEGDPSKCPEHPGDDKDPSVRLDTWNKVKGCNKKGEGPAHVVAAHGLAMAGSALPLNPERLPGASEIAYLNFNNLAAFRDTFRQGVLEQRLFLDALLKLQIPASVVEQCSGLSLPPGETAYRFRAAPVAVQGQSMGGMYANLVAATDPRIEAAVPTGAGGYWSYFILKTQLTGNTAGQIALLLKLTGVKLTHMNPGLHLFQTACEASDPIVYMPRVGRAPLPNHPARSIYEPVGKGDSYFPTTVYDAIALAYGHPMAGQEVWPSMQPALKLAGLDGLLPLPVTEDLTSATGAKYTGAVLQFEGDGVYDAHALYTQLDAVKYQYGCFLKSFFDKGKATIPAVMPLGSACPD